MTFYYSYFFLWHVKMLCHKLYHAHVGSTLLGLLLY